MSDAAIHVSIEECLGSLPAIQEVVQLSGAHFEFAFAPRLEMMKSHSDIALISGDHGDPTLEAWSLCHFRYQPKLLVITAEPPPAYAEEAILRGASGVLTSAASAATIAKALDSVARGELWVDRQTTGRLFERLVRGAMKKNGGGTGGCGELARDAPHLNSS